MMNGIYAHMLGGNKLLEQDGNQSEANNHKIDVYAIYILQAQSPTGSSPGFCLKICEMGWRDWIKPDPFRCLISSFRLQLRVTSSEGDLLSPLFLEEKGERKRRREAWLWETAMGCLSYRDGTYSPGMGPEQNQPKTFHFAGGCPTKPATSVRVPFYFNISLNFTFSSVLIILWNHLMHLLWFPH